jgi:Cu/Ag efflux protein CusF
MKQILLVAVVVACLCSAGSCRRSSGNEKRYDLKGRVVAVERDKYLVTISHEAITGLMPAMTMPFTVRSESDLQILAPEDQVVATLVVDGSQ